MLDVLQNVERDLRTFATDLERLIQNEKDKSKAEEVVAKNDGKPKREQEEVPVPEERRLRSLQRVTTFYKSKKEAVDVQENPIFAFVDKRIKEIFGK